MITTANSPKNCDIVLLNQY